MITRQYPIAFLCLLAVLLVGCASVDFDHPKEVSTAVVDTDNTYLGRGFSSLPQQHPGKSGFYLLGDGIEALAARLLMTRRAERTLDTQYYLITNDSVGFIFIGSLLEAADRGVRVRLLLDDIQTQGYDTGMAALDSHPNFTVRIFNPFSGRSSRGGAITEFNRVNRRMHNKSITADNQVTVIGGRNIADEYFSYRHDVNFGDLDVLVVGPAVRDVSNMFDTYWNSRYAAPIPAFAKTPDDPVAGVDRGGSGAALATLHAKAFLVDRERFFLGSFNFDPRSARINTELGVIIDSPEIGALVGLQIEQALDDKTYEVLLNDKGALRWADRRGEEEVLLEKEPQTSWWRRFSVGFMRILPIKSQL